jgi:hypothetical protein
MLKPKRRPTAINCGVADYADLPAAGQCHSSLGAARHWLVRDDRSATNAANSAIGAS